VVYTVANTLWEARRKGKSSSKVKQDSPVSSNSLVDLLGFLTDDDDGDSTHVYVVIHNIDGPGLRDDDVQQALATLASSKYVRLVASIDNINAPICECYHPLCMTESSTFVFLDFMVQFIIVSI
jgi:origin recognition complex subunit 2